MSRKDLIENTKNMINIIYGHYEYKLENIYFPVNDILKNVIRFKEKNKIPYNEINFSWIEKSSICGTFVILQINGVGVAQVLKLKNCECSEKAAYYENKVLARQEIE